MLQPDEVQTMSIESAYNPKMKSNNYNFSHPNGTVKAKQVAKLEGGDEPDAKPARRRRKRRSRGAYGASTVLKGHGASETGDCDQVIRRRDHLCRDGVAAGARFAGVFDDEAAVLLPRADDLDAEAGGRSRVHKHSNDHLVGEVDRRQRTIPGVGVPEFRPLVRCPRR